MSEERGGRGRGGKKDDKGKGEGRPRKHVA